jgi:putative transposase
MEARVYELGAGDFGRIRRLCHHLDGLVSRIASDEDVRKKQRYRMRRAAARMRIRIRNLVDDLHRRTAKWLCETFEVILYPHYETSRMVVGEGKTRRLRSKTVRAMLTWAHCRFKQHLLHKIREYPSTRVVLVNEAFTSKTCGGCGWINNDLGKSKLFWCERCGFRTDRDWNGARNVWLRFLTEWGPDPIDDDNAPGAKATNRTSGSSFPADPLCFEA